MRKFSALIVLVLTVSTLSPALAAAPKPGTACKTLNQKITSGGQVYTCIKSGSKKVWSKGVKAVVKPKAAPTPSASPSPAASPSPSLTPAPTSSATPSATATPSASPSSTTQTGSGSGSGNGSNSNSGPANINEGFLCDANGPASAKNASGVELFCTKGGDGKSSWRPKQSGGSGSGGSGSGGGSAGTNTQPGSFALGALGSKCTKEGEVGWNGNVVAACKGGVVKYALQADIPATPVSGYTSRPTWYPTLTQILGGSSGIEPTCSPSTIKFTKPVIALDKLAPSIPYGMMVADHVTPIDHAYLGVISLAIPQASRTANDYIAVTAPADGVITELSSLGSPSSHRVVINHGCNIYSVYMVLNKATGVLADSFSKLSNNGFMSLSIPIKAGEEFGRQRDNMLDFNIFDGTQWLSGFANPYSYLTQDTWKPYTADYLPLFTDDIRAGMEKQLQRTSAPRIGKIDQDVIGAAAGNWFLAGTNGYGGNLTSAYENTTVQVPGGSVSGKNTYAWSHLAIARHEVDTSKWILSTGWYKDSKGDPVQFLINLTAGQVTPDKLTASSGAMVYTLSQFSYIFPTGTPARVDGSSEPYPVGYTLGSGTSVGSVILQVNSDNSLSIEFASTFTSDKRTYKR